MGYSDPYALWLVVAQARVNSSSFAASYSTMRSTN